MGEILLGVLQAYEAVGETELANSKPGRFLTARYRTLADAEVLLGDRSEIRQAYMDVQNALYVRCDGPLYSRARPWGMRRHFRDDGRDLG